jgi:hypothetical protein
MNELMVKNVLGQELKVVACFTWDARYAWGSKRITKNCAQCQHCVGREDSVRVVESVNATKGRCQWQSPAKEEILGICNWGVWPKILCPKENPRKCEYFGKPSPAAPKFYYGIVS